MQSTVHWQKYPLVRLAIPFVGGMATANFLWDACRANAQVLVVCLSVLAAFLVFEYFRPAALPRFSVAFGLATFLFVFCFGMLLFSYRHQPVEHTPYKRKPLVTTPFQQWVHDRYASAGVEGDGGSVVEAMTTGNKTLLPRALRRQYAQAGVAHVLALSGLHLGILLSLFDLLLARSYLPRRWRRILALLLIPLLWCYAVAAGLPVSLVRAAAMCSVLQLTLVASAEYNMLNACALAAVVMLCWNPSLLLDIGFQLSFVSIVGIAVMGLPLCHRLLHTQFLSSAPLLRRLVKFFFGTLLITFTCTLFTLPLTAFHFGQVPVYSLLTNLCVSSLVLVVMWGSVAWWAFSWWPAAQTVVGAVLLWCADAMNALVQTVASWPAATFTYRPTPLAVLLLYVLLACLVVYAHFRSARSLQLALLGIIALCLLHAF